MPLDLKNKYLSFKKKCPILQQAIYFGIIKVPILKARKLKMFFFFIANISFLTKKLYKIHLQV